MNLPRVFLILILLATGCVRNQGLVESKANPERLPAALKPFAGADFEWILARSKSYNERKFNVKELQKIPSVLAADEYVYDFNRHGFVSYSRRSSQTDSSEFLEIKFEKQIAVLSLVDDPKSPRFKILKLKIGDETQDLLSFDPTKWTLTLSWAGDHNLDHKLDFVFALGNLHDWMTVLATSTNEKGRSLVSMESFDRENPGHGN